MMMKYDFEASIGYWLTITTNALQRVLGERLSPFGITFRQMQVIAWLVREKRLTQSELAHRMMIEPPTLAGILSRMETCGWITRTQCTTDRRKNWIEVTDKIKPVWKQISACAREVRVEATAGLSEQEQNELFRMLEKVHHNMRGDKSETSRPQTAEGVK